MADIKRIIGKLSKKEGIQKYSIGKKFIYFQESYEILVGFYLEKVSTGIYLWEYIQPMYTLSNSIHFTYSDRCKHLDNILSDEDIVNEISNIVFDENRISKLEKLLQPQLFYDHFNRPELTYEKSTELILTAIYLKQDQENTSLKKLIEQTREYLSTGWSDYLKDDLEFYIKLLESDVNARELLFENLLSDHLSLLKNDNWN